MEIDTSTVRKLAHLARMELSEQEEEKWSVALSDMLDWVGKLTEVDTAGVPPLTQVNEAPCPTRDDHPQNYFTPDEALKNAPETSGDCFVVPKILN